MHVSVVIPCILCSIHFAHSPPRKTVRPSYILYVANVYPIQIGYETKFLATRCLNFHQKIPGMACNFSSLYQMTRIYLGMVYKTNNECFFIRAIEEIFSFGERWNVPLTIQLRNCCSIALINIHYYLYTNLPQG